MQATPIATCASHEAEIQALPHDLIIRCNQAYKIESQNLLKILSEPILDNDQLEMQTAICAPGFDSIKLISIVDATTWLVLCPSDDQIQEWHIYFDLKTSAVGNGKPKDENYRTTFIFRNLKALINSNQLWASAAESSVFIEYLDRQISSLKTAMMTKKIWYRNQTLNNLLKSYTQLQDIAAEIRQNDEDTL